MFKGIAMKPIERIWDFGGWVSQRIKKRAMKKALMHVFM